jgi:hypothetical protein
MVARNNCQGWLRQVLLVVLVMPLLVGVGLMGRCAGSWPAATLMAHVVGMSQPKLVYLQPGLHIDGKPVKGWTHLVIKSNPRITSGEKGTLPAGALKTATLFRSILLANVQPLDVYEKEFELSQIGVGLCVPNPQDEDEDIVVSADRLDALGLNLTTVQRLVLDAAEAEMSEGRIIARTPTFALFRSPAMVVSGDKHLKVNLCYAFCVERMTGRLRVGMWTMRIESEALKAPATMYRLAPNPKFDCELDVRAKRILGMVPFSWSFAMRYLPPGRALRVPPALGESIVATARHPADSDPEELERLVMQTLSTVPDPEIAGAKSGSVKVDPAVRSTAIPPPYAKQR